MASCSYAPPFLLLALLPNQAPGSRGTRLPHCPRPLCIPLLCDSAYQRSERDQNARPTKVLASFYLINAWPRYQPYHERFKRVNTITENTLDQDHAESRCAIIAFFPCGFVFSFLVISYIRGQLRLKLIHEIIGGDILNERLRRTCGIASFSSWKFSFIFAVIFYV